MSPHKWKTKVHRKVQKNLKYENAKMNKPINDPRGTDNSQKRIKHKKNIIGSLDFSKEYTVPIISEQDSMTKE